MRAQVFHDHVMSFHQSLYPEVNIETFCIIRDPIDWAHSWYRYRSRDELLELSTQPRYKHRAAMYCGGVSFENFVLEILKGSDAATYAKIGSQKKYILLENNNIGVDKLFHFENGMKPVEEFLSNKIGIDFEIPKFNESPPKKEIGLSAELKAKLELHFADDYIIYNSNKAT